MISSSSSGSSSSREIPLIIIFPLQERCEEPVVKPASVHELKSNHASTGSLMDPVALY